MVFICDRAEDIMVIITIVNVCLVFVHKAKNVAHKSRALVLHVNSLDV